MPTLLLGFGTSCPGSHLEREKVINSPKLPFKIQRINVTTFRSNKPPQERAVIHCGVIERSVILSVMDTAVRYSHQTACTVEPGKTLATSVMEQPLMPKEPSADHEQRGSD